MSLTRRFLGLLTILALLSMAVSIARAETLAGHIVGVHDGDTVTLLLPGGERIKVRLAQIDAPELEQEFGAESQGSLFGALMDRDVEVVKETIDKYGRTIGMIYLGDTNVNKMQIERGMAWAYRQYVHDKALLESEATARQNKVGLWSGENPVAPWDYRHK